MAVKKSKKTNRRGIMFTCDAPEARQVLLAGSFNDWHPEKHPMRHDGNGSWKKRVMLPPGTYEYKFCIDDQWRHDPSSPHACTNCYGTLNSIITVSPW